MSPGLEGVPLDVFLELVSFLEVHDALSLTLISRKFHVLRSHNSFWHILLRTLHHSSVPLASPPHSELIGDVKDLTLRTLKRQKAMFSSSNPRPVRVRKYLECRHDSICPISGTTMYLTCDLKDGMARCWDLPKGECLSEVYIGRNILAQSTVAADKGMFLVCLLLAESLQEFVATSVVVLCLKYDLDVDLSQSSSFSYSNVRLSVLHRSPLDVTYPAMYPSCAINPDGVVAITKMATSIHIIGINVFHETSCVIETDLTEMEVDSVDLAFNEQDLYLTVSNARTSCLYRCSKDYLPYTPNPAVQNHHLNLSLTTPMPNSSLYSFERCGFYASSSKPVPGNIHSPAKFAVTAYYATYAGNDQFTECCFWDLGSRDEQLPLEPAHRLRLPGLQFFEVPCAGSESGAWGAFVCDVDIIPNVDGIGHDFEVDVGVTVTEAANRRANSSGDSNPDSGHATAEIFLVHYDASTRKSTLYRPQLPLSIPDTAESRPKRPYSWINDIKCLEFDERLGVLYVLMDNLERGVLCAMEFV